MQDWMVPVRLSCTHTDTQQRGHTPPRGLRVVDLGVHEERSDAPPVVFQHRALGAALPE